MVGGPACSRWAWPDERRCCRAPRAGGVVLSVRAVLGGPFVYIVAGGRAGVRLCLGRKLLRLFISCEIGKHGVRVGRGATVACGMQPCDVA